MLRRVEPVGSHLGLPSLWGREVPTGRTDELTRRFGGEAATAITAAYEAVVLHSASSVLAMSTEARLDLVQMLIREVEAGRVDPSHLKAAALAFGDDCVTSRTFAG